MSDGRRTRHDVEARRNAGTCLALTGLVAVGAGLFGLAVVVLPDLLKAGVFLAVIVGFVLFHYVTWGWLMSRPRAGDEQFDEPRSEIGGYPPIDHAADLGDD